MHAVLPALVALLFTGAIQAQAPIDAEIAAVMARDAELAAAHGRGDFETYRAGLSKDYVYIDIGGKRVTIDTLLARRAADHRRVVSSESSEEESVRLSDSVVLLRGLERSVSSYYGGLPRVSSTRWTAVWVREDDGVWRLVADTATPVREDDTLPFVHSPQPDSTLEKHAGQWTLATDPPMTMQLGVQDGELLASLDGQQVQFHFVPASDVHYIARERPFELRFSREGQTLELVTWGTATAATRVTDLP